MAKTTTTDPHCSQTRAYMRRTASALRCARANPRHSWTDDAPLRCARSLARPPSATVRELRRIRGPAPRCGVRLAPLTNTPIAGSKFD